MDEYVKKNILDLQFQKYLIISSTAVIVAFTYFIGIATASITKQINFKSFVVMAALFIILTGVLGICAIIFFSARFHLKRIPEVLKEIK